MLKSNRRHNSCAAITSYLKLRFSFSDLIVVTTLTKILTTFRLIGGYVSRCVNARSSITYIQ